MLKSVFDDKGCATVTLDRPKLHNTFDELIIAELTGLFSDLTVNPDVRIIVLAANGNSFCAGADLNWMKRMAKYDYDENIADSKALANMLHTISICPKPIICKVQGSAYGGGVGLISVCDIAIASLNAKFAFSEVKLGITPATISPYVIEAIGKRQAHRYFLSAEIFDAEKALELGLIHQVVQPDELNNFVDRLVKNMMRNSPAAMSAAKELIRKISKEPINKDILDYTAKCIANIRATAEGQEGITAFLAKRKPSWAKE
ncbi:MAG: hypothetical protein CMF69_02430 [Magnetovibrio sp.]|nr:hypothetical protein [Magnetovibrio sp.]|tara:strand:- start:62 stop:841 length:780 start_codon:yes stop_codon:yes gene_type:complete